MTASRVRGVSGGRAAEGSRFQSRSRLRGAPPRGGRPRPCQSDCPSLSLRAAGRQASTVWHRPCGLGHAPEPSRATACPDRRGLRQCHRAESSRCARRVRRRRARRPHRASVVVGPTGLTTRRGTPRPAPRSACVNNRPRPWRKEPSKADCLPLMPAEPSTGSGGGQPARSHRIVRRDKVAGGVAPRAHGRAEVEHRLTPRPAGRPGTAWSARLCALTRTNVRGRPGPARDEATGVRVDQAESRSNANTSTARAVYGPMPGKRQQLVEVVGQLTAVALDATVDAQRCRFTARRL